MTRVLIGGVGYRNLRDHSAGVVLIDRLGARQWAANVCVEDISYNPIAVVQRLQDDPPARRFGLVVIVGAVQRESRAPGSLSVYRWDGCLPPAEIIHEAITEAVTGIIALDNTVVIARHFEALPGTVVVVEVEPGAHEFGDELTPAVGDAVDQAELVVAALAAHPETAHDLSEGALPPARTRHSGVVFTRAAHDIRIH